MTKIILAILTFLFIIYVIWCILEKVLGGFATLIPWGLGILFVSWLIQLLLGVFGLDVSVWLIFFLIIGLLMFLGYKVTQQEQKQKSAIKSFFKNHQMGNMRNIVDYLEQQGLENVESKLIWEVIDELIAEGKIIEELPRELWRSLYETNFVTTVETIHLNMDD
ncbi:hypothetical protein [Moraxella marmotae]|uniref:hypothetical protein n=1 Tax=Moraxella marmotae TaxID=3344520 RepID=UPI0035F23B0D